MISILNSLQKLKNKLFILLFIIIIIIIFLIMLFNRNSNTFSFEKKYYGSNKFIELNEEILNNLVDNKESFGIFIYQPLCINSYNFNKVVTEFAYQYQMNLYKMPFSKIENTILNRKIKYYPSFVIFKKGIIVDYLDAESDQDLAVYNSVAEFKKWFGKYVNIRRVNKGSNNQEKPETDKDIQINTVLNNIKYDKEKINIYFFWGDGCPHCDKLFKFFNSLEMEFGKYFTLHSFEVWKNKENKNLLDQFSKKMKDEVGGVPYVIIGNESFVGYREEYETKILEIIKDEYQDSYDVYFSK